MVSAPIRRCSMSYTERIHELFIDLFKSLFAPVLMLFNFLIFLRFFCLLIFTKNFLVYIVRALIASSISRSNSPLFNLTTYR